MKVVKKFNECRCEPAMIVFQECGKGRKGGHLIQGSDTHLNAAEMACNRVREGEGKLREGEGKLQKDRGPVVRAIDDLL